MVQEKSKELSMKKWRGSNNTWKLRLHSRMKNSSPKWVRKNEILKNLGSDSIISLYGSNESSWEASVYIIDIAKQNNIKISLNGNKK